uniref:Uncharacterized protein n=1 Tax=Megaselia scalaris TaxID=36166 RepID=T1GE08_MEGSC
MFERENRREKILEAKFRESKLKVKVNNPQDQNDNLMTGGRINIEPIKGNVEQSEVEYLASIEEEKRRRASGDKDHRSVSLSPKYDPE